MRCHLSLQILSSVNELVSSSYAYCKIGPDALRHPAIFGILHLTYNVLCYTKSCSGILNNMVVWLLENRVSVFLTSTCKVIVLLHNQGVFIPTFVIPAPPSTDETVAEVEDELMSHIMRSADRLNMVSEVEGRAEEHKCHIVVGGDVIVVLVHFDSTDGADLGFISWSR